MRSNLMPCSSSARMAPMCAQPRELPEPSASPIRGLRVKVPRVYGNWGESPRKSGSDPDFSDALEDRGDALAAADAHGHERVALLRALQLVERLHREDAAGGADRMAERHGAAVRVDLRGIETEIFGHRHRLHGERFVGLDQVHVG